MAGRLCRRCGEREATVQESVARLVGLGAAEAADDYTPAHPLVEAGPTLCEPCAVAYVDSQLGPGSFVRLLEAGFQFEAFRASLEGLPLEEQNQRIREYVRLDVERMQRDAAERRPGRQ